MGGGVALAATPLRAARMTSAKAPAPWGAPPSPRQRAWHRRETYAFVHFTVNTFTDKEWGYGDENPALFNPTDFNADQIVAAAKAGNLHGIVLTAKHHDGFCLWPTPLTEHCVRNSPYKDGKGDIVREFADACRRGGIAFGIYLSPWDRNRAEYGRPAYIEYFRAQLNELCTQYGTLFEVWFDGANGGDGYYGGARETRKIDAEAYYQWPSIVDYVHSMQPMACTFEPRGADLRWVGNEGGVAGDPCWPTMDSKKAYTQSDGFGGIRGGDIWWPAETNTSIRPGWFYHADEDTRVKSPETLTKIFDESVGRSTNMILNLTPDRRGRVPDQDVASLTAFGDALRASFAKDLARNAVAHASAERGRLFRAANVLDGQRDTYWSTPDEDVMPMLTLDLAPGTQFDLIRLRENIALGVRVTCFAVDADMAGDGNWQEIVNKQLIGSQRILRLAQPIMPRRIRLRILEAPACPAITEFALFKSVTPRTLTAEETSSVALLDRALLKVVAASAPRAEILFDGDGLTTWFTSAPGSLTIDLGRRERIAGFSLVPMQDWSHPSTPPPHFVFETSEDGVTWERRSAGEFSNIVNSRQTQRVHLGQAVAARQVRLTFLNKSDDRRQLAISEIDILAPF